MKKNFMKINLLAFILTILFTNTVLADFIEEKKYGNEFSDGYVKIKTTTDGGYVAVGHVGMNDGEANSLITKFDANGNIEWEKQGGSQVSNQIFDIVITSNNEYIVLEECRSIETGVQAIIEYNIKKYNNDGDMIYTISIQDNIHTPYGMSATKDGGCIIVGGTSLYKENEIRHPAVYFKINSEGQFEWYKYYKNSSSFQSVQTTGDGGFIVVGNITTLDDFGNGTPDGLIVKFNQAGEVEWDQRYGGSNSDVLDRVIETTNGEYIAIGDSSSKDLEKIENKGMR